MSERHLWEPEHSYAVCVQTMNYFATVEEGGPFRHDSWAAFAAKHERGDDDYNFVVRWDWHRQSEDTGWEHDELAVYFLHQRKGLFACHLVRVTGADEPAARAWLARKWEYLRKLWAPLAP